MSTPAPVETVSTAADKAKLAGSVVLLVGGVAAFYLLAQQPLWMRVLALLALLIAAVVVFFVSEPGKQLIGFGRDSAREVRKVMLGGIVCEPDDGCAPIVLICRSGKRSMEAGRVLLEAGFKRVFSINEGFEGELDDHHHRSTVGGWRFHGLPWEQC